MAIGGEFPRRRKSPACLPWIAILALLAPLAMGEAIVELQGDWKRHDADRTLQQQIGLASEIASYTLAYDISIPAGTPEGRCTSRIQVNKQVPLGMTAPINANWYYQSFLGVRVDDLSLHDVPLSFRTVRSGGSDGMIEGEWKTPKGPVYLRLAIRGGDDKLLMQVAMAPETAAKRLEVSLLAYPQAFQKPWDRQMITATRDLPAQQNVTLDPARENWALYYDGRMTREHVGGGPCGVAYVPDEVEPVRVGLGPYSISTRLVATADSRKVTVGLWDFTPIADASVMAEHLRRDGGLIAKDLAAVASSDWHKPLAGPSLSASYAGFLATTAKKRFEPTPFDQMTGEFVTPHLRWAKPLAGGPVRALFVAPRWNQRETVEVAQRLDLAYDTVSFCKPDAVLDPGLYLYDSYDVYGYPRKTQASVIMELSDKLSAPRDALVLSGFKPEIIPDYVRRRIIEKTREGTGLILLGSANKMLDQFGDGLEPATWHCEGIPVDRLPALDKMIADKKAVWNAFTFGKGRVLAFNYATGGHGGLSLTPSLPADAPDVIGYYDYYHSLFCRGVLWAANRILPAAVDFPGDGKLRVRSTRPVKNAQLEMLVHDPARGYRQHAKMTIDIAEGDSTHALPDIGPSRGPRYTSVWLRDNGAIIAWSTGYADIPSAPLIAAIELNKPVATAGETVGGTIRLGDIPEDASLAIELWDSRGRLLASKTVAPTTSTVPFEFTLPRPVSIVHEIRARLTVAGSIIDQRVAEFSAPDQSIDDFHFLAWCGAGNNAIDHAIMRALADGGIDWIDNTGMTGATETTARALVRNAAKCGMRSIPYATRIHSDQMSDRVRKPCLTDPAHLKRWADDLRGRARGAAPYGPPGYTLGDENFLVSKAPLDVCISPTCLAGFREWLKRRHGSLDALNAVWRTGYRDWQDVVPATCDEVRKTPEHWPRWADHRMFMSRVFSDAHSLGRETIRQEDPKARVGFDGLFTLDSWHGYDFYRLCKACDLVQVYALHNPSQLEYLRCWHLPGAIVGSWFNELGNRDEISARRLGWHLLFHDFNSSWYWSAYRTGPALLFPDLRPTPEFQWLQSSHAEIMGGVGKLLMRAKRQHDGIAIHYSQASVYANTLLSRPMDSAQLSAFALLLEDLGLQYDVVAYEQIEQGCLANYKALFLPASTALSTREADAMRKFVEAGGLLVADTTPGILDDHCRLLERGLLDDVLGIARSGLPVGKDTAKIRVISEQPGAELPVTAHDVGLKAAASTPRAMAGDTPAVLENRAGNGRAVLLNFAIEQYTGLRLAGQGISVRDYMRGLICQDDLRPMVRVVTDDGDVPACEIVRYADGPIEYVCLLTDNACANVKAEDVEIRLPHASFVYDVRARQSMGQCKTTKTRLLPGDPKVYALLPYGISDVGLFPASAKVRAGTPASFDAKINAGGKTPRRHCFRIEVLDPEGKTVRHYAQNVLAEDGHAKISIPLAMNDRAGQWQVQMTDVATGRSAKSTLEVTP